MRLSVSIYRSDYDCDINILHGHKDAILVWDEEISQEDIDIIETGNHGQYEGRKVLILARRNCGGEYLTAYPINEHKEGKWLMCGGTYISTSDSRFPSRYPIPLHDRYEG